MTRATTDPRTHRRCDSARRVRDLLRAAIIHEELPAGALPGETELMLSFSASRRVVRDALAMLRDEGLVVRVQGTGTLSVSSKVRHSYTHLHGPRSRTGVVRHRVLAAAEETAPPRVAERLGIAPGGRCGVVEFVTTLGDEPYSVCTTYLPAGLTGLVREAGSFPDWYALLESAGHELGVTEQAVEAILADPLVADLLAVPPGSPLMLFERRIHDVAGRPVEYAFVRIRGDRLALLAELPRRSLTGEEA